MPVQKFSRPETENPIVEVRWDFGFENVEVVYEGRMLGKITDSTTFREHGVSTTTPDGKILDLHLASSGGEDHVVVYLAASELEAHEVQWGVAPKSADLRPEFFGHGREPINAAFSRGYEKAILKAQKWLWYLGIANLLFAAMTPLGKDFLSGYLSEDIRRPLSANVFTGSAFGVLFMILAFLTSRRRAILTLSTGIVLTGLSIASVGQLLLETSDYAGLAVSRIMFSLLGLFIIVLGLQSATAQRSGKAIRDLARG